MKLWKKIALGALLLVIAVIGAGTYLWFNRELPPIEVAGPGEGGQRVMIGDMPANYFPPAGPGPSPAILLLGGSEGSLKETRNVYARALAAQGYAVLYPGYYKTREDNRSFDMVPLEGFDEAITWMRSRPEIDKSRIAVIGHSKGAEAALLVASSHPEIRAVVAAMPSDVVWQGFDFDATDMSKFRSSWSRADRPLPYVRYIAPHWYDWFSGEGLIKMYRQSWAKADRYPEAKIPGEKIDASVLLICGGRDMIWPSCEMARAIQSRLQSTQKKSVVVLPYPEAGHWAFGPVDHLHTSDRQNLGRLGGTAKTDMAARQDQWPRVIAFLEKSLRTP